MDGVGPQRGAHAFGDGVLDDAELEALGSEIHGVSRLLLSEEPGGKGGAGGGGWNQRHGRDRDRVRDRDRGEVGKERR